MVNWGSISPLDPSYLVTATWLVTGMKHLLSTAGASLPTGRSSSQRSVSPSVRSSVRGAGGRQGTGHLIYSPHLYGALTLMAILTEHIGIYIGPPEEGKLFHKQIQEYTSSVHPPTHPTNAKTKTICDMNCLSDLPLRCLSRKSVSIKREFLKWQGNILIVLKLIPISVWQVPSIPLLNIPYIHQVASKIEKKKK